MCEFLQYCALTKLYMIEIQCFEVRCLCTGTSSSEHNFTVSLQKCTVFELLHLQNPFLNTFFAYVPKMPKDIKQIRTKATVDIKSALSSQIEKSCKTFAENYFKTLIFSKLALFHVSAGQNTVLNQPNELFSYRNPFDS